MVCKRCGAEMLEGSNFCTKCGYKAATTYEEQVSKITLKSIIVSVVVLILFYYLRAFSLTSYISRNKLLFFAESIVVLLVISALLSYCLVLNAKVFNKKTSLGVIPLLINIGIGIKIIIYLVQFFIAMFS